MEDRQEVFTGPSDETKGTRRAEGSATRAQGTADEAMLLAEDAVVFATDLRSDNYEPGVSGWLIDRATGSAEFQNGTFRGDILASSIVAEASIESPTITGGQLNGAAITISSGASSFFTVTASGDVNVAALGTVDSNGSPFRISFEESGGSGQLVLSAFYGVSVGGALTAQGLTSSGAASVSGLFQTGTSAIGLETATVDSRATWRPRTAGAGYLGNSSRRWRQAFVEVAEDVASDRRLKDVHGAAPGLDLIGRLDPVAYTLKGDDDGMTHWGLIAQDVERAVGPHDAVVSRPEGPDGRYGLAYTELVAPLVRAVQELSGQVEELRSRLAAAEAAG